MVRCRQFGLQDADRLQAAEPLRPGRLWSGPLWRPAAHVFPRTPYPRQRQAQRRLPSGSPRAAPVSPQPLRLDGLQPAGDGIAARTQANEAQHPPTLLLPSS